MSFSKFGPGGEFGEWSRRIHQMMDEMFTRSFLPFRDNGEWQPETNLYESRDAYHVCMDLAGMERESIDVQSVGDTSLVVSGQRCTPRPEARSELSILVMEIDEGRFRRRIDTPEPIDQDGIEAHYDRGFLWIRLPKAKTA
jgi:HSP20 family protein